MYHGSLPKKKRLSFDRLKKKGNSAKNYLLFTDLRLYYIQCVKFSR